MVRRLKLAGIAILCVLTLGTVGYRLGGIGWLDALYQTVITVSTVGYADLADETMRPFTIILIGVGTVVIAVLISVVTGSVLELQLREILGSKKMESRVRKLTGHLILCGFGRFGRTVASRLGHRRMPFVAIERDATRAKIAVESEYLVLEADATEEETLTRAGIERAAALLTTLDTDAANVYVTLTAKQMNRSVRVVALAHAEGAASKLQAAGADEVVSPYQVGGSWMAQAVTSPAVADFMKMATGVNPLNFYMDEQLVHESSTLRGSRLRDTPIRSSLGVIVLAVRRRDGTLVTNPAPDLMIDTGDTLVSLGERERLDELKRMAAGE